METIKKSDDYTVVKKRSGRFGVLGKNNKWVNGEEKVKILLSEGLIKVSAPGKKAAPQESEVAEVSEGADDQAPSES